MILALLLSLAPAITQADDPPAVRVRLNHEQFSRGDRARVYVETAQDGYLVVLHADPEGRVRVLFPLDPTDDAFVRGGKRQELRGRSGRHAIFVDGEDGTGTVLAAVARDPFTYDGFVRNDHWDYRALGGPSLKDDPLAGLLDIVRGMTGETRFEYDAATYVVGRQIAARYGYGSGYGYGYPYRFRLGLSFGYPYRFGYAYDRFYDPLCYDPFWSWSASCYGYRFGYSFYRHRPYGYGRTFLGGGFAGRGGSRFVIPQGRGRYTPVEARPRVRSDDPAPARDRGAISRGVEPRRRGGSVNPPARSWGAKPSIAPRGRDGNGVSRGRPSVSRGGSGGSRPTARPSGGGRRGGGSGVGGGGRRH